MMTNSNEPGMCAQVWAISVDENSRSCAAEQGKQVGCQLQVVYAEVGWWSGGCKDDGRGRR